MKTTQVFAELERGVHAALETYSNVHRGSGHHLHCPKAKRPYRTFWDKPTRLVHLAGDCMLRSSSSAHSSPVS